MVHDEPQKAAIVGGCGEYEASRGPKTFAALAHGMRRRLFCDLVYGLSFDTMDAPHASVGKLGDQSGVSIGLPLKNAARFCSTSVTEACTASGERPAMCGVMTTLGRSSSSAGGAGSLS